jgi:hypothetical protein
MRITQGFLSTQTTMFGGYLPQGHAPLILLYSRQQPFTTGSGNAYWNSGIGETCDLYLQSKLPGDTVEKIR